MTFSLQQYESQRKQIGEYFSNELHSLRTGRAHAAMVESLPVIAYGIKQPLKAVASISIPDAHTISIEPWDKAILKDVEKSISSEVRGMSITNEGNKLRATLAPLSEENRKELVKVIQGVLEEARIRLRKLRDDIRQHILDAQQQKTVTEDDKFRLFKKLDEWITESQSQFEEETKQKETEMMTV